MMMRTREDDDNKYDNHPLMMTMLMSIPPIDTTTNQRMTIMRARIRTMTENKGDNNDHEDLDFDATTNLLNRCIPGREKGGGDDDE